jgi:hypothetical protein
MRVIVTGVGTGYGHSPTPSPCPPTHKPSPHPSHTRCGGYTCHSPSASPTGQYPPPPVSASPHPTHTHTHRSPAPPQLAHTGVDSEPLFGVGLALLLAGIAVLAGMGLLHLRRTRQRG